METRRTDLKTVRVLALRGAPGVGKSTVGRLLVDRRGAGAVVEVDRFRAMFAKCDWHDRAQHAVALDAACRAAIAFVQSGVVPVVLIDTFGRDGLARARGVLASPGLCLPSFTLWAGADALGQRLSGRMGGYSDAEQSVLLNDEVMRVRPDDDLLIDTTLLDAAAVVECIEATLSIDAGRSALHGVGDRAATGSSGPAE